MEGRRWEEGKKERGARGGGVFLVLVRQLLRFLPKLLLGGAEGRMHTLVALAPNCVLCTRGSDAGTQEETEATLPAAPVASAA